MPVDYEAADRLLRETFAKAEQDLLRSSPPSVNLKVQKQVNVLFSSTTQAYREVLLGCIIARIQDKSIQIRAAYLSLGVNAFSGRSLDERVINPFLQEKEIPCSRGPYLSVFRRSVRFDSSIRQGLRDKEGYDGFLRLLQYLERTPSSPELELLLRYVLYKFGELREKSKVTLAKLSRMSLEQYDFLVSRLMETPSAGRFPVLLVVATFQTIKEIFNLNWDIQWQQINVADAPSGAVGDITITRGRTILMAIEVTERPVDRSRVRATFTTKIARQGIEDYLFFVTRGNVQADAMEQARQYFVQGHEINFLEIKDWILRILATVGKKGRATFQDKIVDRLSERSIPSVLKVVWNGLIDSISKGEV